MVTSPPRALFAVSSLGLGHATRILAIIHDHLRCGWEATIISSGNALTLMHRELGDRDNVTFMEMADYPALERGSGWRLYWYLGIDLLQTWRLIQWEHKQVEKIAANYDVIYSDGRYGFYSEATPSFIVTHQIAFMPPRLLRFMFRLTSPLNLIGLRKFDSIIIPDFPDPENSLSTKLSHTHHLQNDKHCFIGLLSSYEKIEVEQDIDYLFVISGYLVEHKESFIGQLLHQSLKLPGKKVFVLGQQDLSHVPVEFRNREDLELLPMVHGQARQNLFNRARRVVSRSGYTTIMDLVEHDKPGILFPTPNQTEQEYLATNLKRRNLFTVQDQQQVVNLGAAAAACEKVTPFSPPWRTHHSLEILRKKVEPFMQKRFFSIVVPAHNEEFELETTLHCLLNQVYPAERYEIIVVENGSTDNTFPIACKMEKLAAEQGHPIRLLQSKKGVSAAKNTGLSGLSPASDWVVFCDADTQLEPHFLHQLNTRLNRSGEEPAVGTCSIRPVPEAGFYAKRWFEFYDFMHRITKTSYSLQIAKSDVARRVRFDNTLELGEDLLFIQQCRKFGSFFFLDTDQVSTSTRRFRSVGYLRLSLYWTFGALVPHKLKQTWNYHVIR